MPTFFVYKKQTDKCRRLNRCWNDAAISRLFRQRTEDLLDTLGRYLWFNLVDQFLKPWQLNKITPV